ncbi:MAG: DNA starvation/stationary phase protection protein [Melioribacteraceae bacterium]|nr:DNA starvation/stationary phase protection protein [Melioribacteraceae bacterium]
MKNHKLIGLLNNNIANLQVLYVKLHNYHWNVKGINFMSVHELTEKYYDYFAEQYDEVAERVVQLGAKPLSSLQEYLKNARIQEEKGNVFDSKTVIESVLADFEMLNKDYKEIAQTAGEIDDAPTSALAEGNIAWLEKQIWMLKVSIA